MKVVVGSTTFISKAKAKETVREMIYDIGITQEVDNPLLYELIKLHYDYANKTKNMVSLGIEARDRGLGLVIYTDTGKTVISWNCCFDGEKSYKALLNTALRTSIDQQIQDYKRSNFPSLCHLCDDEATEADHIYEFRHIRDEFLNSYTERPNDFRKNQWNRCCFLEGEPMEALFQEYHRKVATYRPLCQRCNANRNIIDRTT